MIKFPIDFLMLLDALHMTLYEGIGHQKKNNQGFSASCCMGNRKKKLVCFSTSSARSKDYNFIIFESIDKEIY